MSYQILKDSANRPLLFLMVDSTDHISPKTGLSPTVTLSKNGGSYAAPSGAVSELANGWYKVAPHANDADTEGPLLLHATATGADPADAAYEVTTRAGYSLAATGLDLIATTAPSGPATTFPGMVVQTWRRFFRKSTLTSAQLKTYADDGVTLITTQAVSDSAGTQTVGNAT